MLKKSFRRKSKKLKSKKLKSKKLKRVSKKSQKKISKKKAFSPSAAVIVPVVIGTLGLLTASGYYGIKYYKENVIKNKDCGICRDKIADINKYEKLQCCTHIFHKDCMEKWTDSQFVMVHKWEQLEQKNWYQLNYTCPVCRCFYHTIYRKSDKGVVGIIEKDGKIPSFNSSV